MRVANMAAPVRTSESSPSLTRVPSGNINSFSPPRRMRMASFSAPTSALPRFTPKMPAFFSKNPSTGHFIISSFAITWTCFRHPRQQTTYSGSPSVLWLPQISAAPSGTFSTPTARHG